MKLFRVRLPGMCVVALWSRHVDVRLAAADRGVSLTVRVGR